MNWNELKKVWCSQPLPAWEAGSRTEIEREFAVRQRQMARRLFWRDVREAGAGVLVAGLIGGVGWSKGLAVLPIAAAELLLLGVTVFFVRERIRAHRNRLGPGAALRVKLEAEIAELQHQRRLLLNVGAWYLAPLAAVIVLVLAALWAKVPPGAPPAWAWIFLGCYVALCALLFWWVWALNRRGVRKWLEPRIEELEKLLNDLGDSPSTRMDR